MAKIKGIGAYRRAHDREEYWFGKAKNRFAVTISRLMDFRGMKQKDLADKLGQSPASVSKILRGDKNLTIESMVKIVRALDAEVRFEVAPNEAATPPWLVCFSGGKNINELKESESKFQESWKRYVTEEGGAKRAAGHQ